MNSLNIYPFHFHYFNSTKKMKEQFHKSVLAYFLCTMKPSVVHKYKEYSA